MKIGLCLSGGGARGIYHIGVLQAFSEAGIEFSVISGTSAGALVGVLYASGIPPKEMLAIALNTKWFNFIRPSLPERGLIGMDYLESILKKNIPYDGFESLRIPAKITATNLTLGSLDVFDKGSVIAPVLASCCIPMLFKPIRMNGHLFLDGGILLNMPAVVIRQECDLLIGVSLLPLVANTEYDLNSSFKLLTRVLELAINSNSCDQKDLCDILVESPEIASISKFDLRESERLYQLGYLTGKASVPLIYKKIENQLSSTRQF